MFDDRDNEDRANDVSHGQRNCVIITQYKVGKHSRYSRTHSHRDWIDQQVRTAQHEHDKSEPHTGQLIVDSYEIKQS